MFSPRFIVTNKTLKSIVDLEKSAMVVGMATLQPDWEAKLKLEGLIRRTVAAMRFVENQLNTDDITKIIKDDPGRDDKPAQVAVRVGIVAKEKDIQKVINWLNAEKLIEQTAFLSNKFKQGAFSEKDLMAIDQLLEERMAQTADLGKYRTEVAEELTKVGAALPVEIPYQVEDLFSWYKGADRTEIHPLLKAGVMFLEIMRIRPFGGSNVLTALLFFELILASEGLGLKGIWSIGEELFKNKQRFEEMVEISTEGNDLTGWFEFLSKVLAEVAEKAKVKIVNLVGEGPIFKTEGGRAVSLTERQITIMEEMTIQSEMTIKEIRAILPMVSDDTILRDLKDLMSKKMIKKKGKTKGAVYVLGKVKGFK